MFWGSSTNEDRLGPREMIISRDTWALSAVGGGSEILTGSFSWLWVVFSCCFREPVVSCRVCLVVIPISSFFLFKKLFCNIPVLAPFSYKSRVTLPVSLAGLHGALLLRHLFCSLVCLVPTSQRLCSFCLSAEEERPDGSRGFQSLLDFHGL